MLSRTRSLAFAAPPRDELASAMESVLMKDGILGFLTGNHFGWTFIPFLMDVGGAVFRQPPEELTPRLDTPEAIAQPGAARCHCPLRSHPTSC